jgi:type II secretion system protein G
MKNTTLIEIAVLVLAAATIICGGCATNQQTQTNPQAHSADATAAAAAEEKMHGDIGALSRALLAYKLDLGTFPMSEQGLNALVQTNGAGAWKGPYVQEIPRTPWGGNYRYEIREFSFAADLSSTMSSHKGYMISVRERPNGAYYCVPKNQFEGSVGFDSYLVYDVRRGLGIKSPSQVWSWYDIK